MDTSLTAVIVIVIFALIAVAVLIRFRKGASAEIKGPFGTSLKVDGTNNDALPRGGINAEGIKSRKGGLLAENDSPEGINIRNVDVEEEVLLSNKNSAKTNDPKAPPPT